MAHLSLVQMHQSAATPTLPGTWKLGAGRAITLQPQEAGALRIAHGRVWATFDGPHGHTPDDSGDRVVGVGQALYIRAGQRVVVEAWSGRAPAYFSWDPMPEAVRERRASAQALVQPLRDLRLAVGLGFGAVGRLVVALVGLAAGLLGVRTLGAPSKVCRAQGA
jgi:hypothetical protein